MNSVWAEDGFFLTSSLTEPFPSPILDGFAGYSCLLPRLFAEVAVLLPIGWAAVTFSLSAAVVTVGCAFVVWHASRPHLPDPILRGVMASAVILVPVVGQQTLGSISYLQWILFLPTFWLLLWKPSSTRAAVGAAVFLAISLATAPLALALAPLALVRLIATQGRRDGLLVAGFALGAFVQLAVIATSQATGGAAGWKDTLLSAYLLRVVSETFVGHPISAAAWEATGDLVLVLAAVAFAAIVAVCALRPHVGRVVSLLALALSVGLFLALGYQRDPFGAFMWPDGQSNTVFARYMVTPALLLLAAILIQLQHGPARTGAAAWRLIRGGVLGCVVLAAATSFYVGTDQRSVKWSVEVARARDRCRADRKPSVVVVPTSPPEWVLNVPCSKLLE